MFKKIIAMLMIFVMSSGTVTAFAAQKELSQETINEDGVEKTIQYIGDNEIVTWEDGDKVYVEQYDLDGNFIESAIGNRDNKEVEVTNEEESYTMNVEDVVEVVDSKDVPSIKSSSSSYKKVGRIKAYNSLTNTKKTMYLYEKLGRAKNTAYKVKRYNGSLANFISNLATGLAMTATGASLLTGNIVGAGIGVITGKAIDITSSITLSCKAYAYSYYGKDSSGSKSKTFSNCGHKYIINDDNHKAFYNDKYYDGFVYGKINDTCDYNLSVMIVRNLYGVDYDVN